MSSLIPRSVSSDHSGSSVDAGSGLVDYLTSCLDVVVDQFSYAENALRVATDNAHNPAVLGDASIAYWRAVHHNAIFLNKLWFFGKISSYDPALNHLDSQARNALQSLASTLSEGRYDVLHSDTDAELLVHDMVRPFRFSMNSQRAPDKPSLTGLDAVFSDNFGLQERFLTDIIIGWKHEIGKTRQDVAYAIEATNIAARRIIPEYGTVTGQIPWVRPEDRSIASVGSSAFSPQWPEMPSEDSLSVNQRLMARAIIACYRAAHHVKATSYEGYWLSTKLGSELSPLFEAGHSQLSEYQQKLCRISRILSEHSMHGRAKDRVALRNFSLPVKYFLED